MTRLPRPCLGAKDPDTGRYETCGRPVTGAGSDRVARCERHQEMYERGRRPTAARRGYDGEYRREREGLLAVDPLTGEPPICQLQIYCKGDPATTLHHVVPVDAGRNVAAARAGAKIPACARCNYGLGKREAPRPSGGGTPDRRGAEDANDDGWFPPP